MDRRVLGDYFGFVGYARVPIGQQTTNGQIDSLKTAGCDRVFTEAMSGTRTDRPQLAAALAFMRDGDVLVVASLDRLARSVRQLLTTMDGLQERGIGLRSLRESVDTTTATGRLVLHIFAALGQFEVELLRERTRNALAASRARGRVGGRPPVLDAIKVTAPKAMMASGEMTAREIARQLGCTPSTLYRHPPGGRTGAASGVSAIGVGAAAFYMWRWVSNGSEPHQSSSCLVSPAKIAQWELALHRCRVRPAAAEHYPPDKGCCPGHSQSGPFLSGAGWGCFTNHARRSQARRLCRSDS